MIVCPVCEHQQAAGSECEVCGRHLVEGRGTDAPVAPLEGLEPTLFDRAAAPAEALPELETTHFEAAELPLLTEDLADLEPTRAEPVEVPPDVTPDVERVQAGLPDDGPTLFAITATCDFCGAEALPGERICRCGMRLAQLDAGRGRAGVAAEPRLCSCGTPVTRSRCPTCGARNEVA